MKSSLWGFVCTGAVGKDISYDKEVAPILEEYCVTCHGPDDCLSGVRLGKLTVEQENLHLMKQNFNENGWTLAPQR